MTELSRFFNRLVLLYALIVVFSTLAVYTVQHYTAAVHIGWTATTMLLYIAIVATSAAMINRRDDFSGYIGFNYHLVTYLACVSIPLFLNAVFGTNIEGIGPMALTWGIGVFVHFLIFWIWFRKRLLRSYDKREIFQ